MVGQDPEAANDEDKEVKIDTGDKNQELKEAAVTTNGYVLCTVCHQKQ